jgi:hypothetical protein
LTIAHIERREWVASATVVYDGRRITGCLVVLAAGPTGGTATSAVVIAARLQLACPVDQVDRRLQR